VRILDRYMARQFLTTFSMLVLGLPLLFIIADVTDNIDRYLDRGVSLGDLGLAYVFFYPQFVVYAFPIAALVATVFTIGGMTRHQEITAAKSGGVSFWRLLLPIGVISIGLAGTAFALGELVPGLLVRRAALIGEGTTTGSGPRINFVFQTEREGMLSVRRLDPGSGEMMELTLERNVVRDAPGVHLIARRAIWRELGGWRLEDVWRRELLADGTERAEHFDTIALPGLIEKPEELLAEPRDPELMRYSEISRFIGAIERSGGNAAGLRVERAQKVAIAVAVIVIVLFGAPLATAGGRGGTAYGVGVSLGVTIIYMLMFRVARAIGGSGAVDPVLAAWAPNLLFLAAGIVLLARVRT
jgi:lipopolysaccharide export system permease protein